MSTGQKRDADMDRLLRAVLKPASGGPDSAGSDAGQGDCPDAGLLAAFVEGTLAAGEQSALESHMAGCERCQAALAILSHDLPQEEEPAAEPASGWFTWVTRPRLRWLVPISAAATVAVVIFATRPLIAPEGEVPGTEVTRMAQAPSEPAEAALPRLDVLREEGAAPAKESVTPKGQQEARITRAGQVPDAKQVAAAPADVPPPGERVREKQAVEPAAEMMAVRVASEEKRAQPAAPAPVPPAGAPAPPAGTPVPPAGAPVAVAQQAAGVLVATDTARKPTAGEAGRAAPMAGSARMEARNLQAGPVTVSAPGGAVRWRFGAGGRIWRSVDAGGSWQAQASGVTADLLAGAAPSSEACWIVGASGTVLLATDGARWERRPFPVTVDLVAVDASGADAATVTARDGRRFSTIDAGLSWSPKQQ